MPKPRPPYLHREKTRHGNFVWYVRVNRLSPRVRIHAPFGTPDFMAEYHAALTGSSVPTIRDKIVAGSLEWLVRQWQRSSDWHLTAEATKRQRENILDRILTENGSVPFKSITAKAITAGRERRFLTPAAANNFLKVMRALFKWAADPEIGHVIVDPAAKVKFLPNKTEGHEVWSADDIAAFRNRWPVGGRERLAMELLLWTGLRRGDAVRLGRQHVKDGMIYIKTEKTGVAVVVPLMAELQAVLAAGPTGDLAFIAGVNGKPMTKEAFGNWFRQACKAAGVAGSAHGLRKASATIAADGGATEKELQSVFGWQTNSQSLAYTRKADGTKLAKALGEKLSGNTYSRTGEQVRESREKPVVKSRRYNSEK